MSSFANEIAQKQVRDCMTSPAVSVGPDVSARKAAEIMLHLKVSGLPVVDAQGRPLGVVSEGDFRFADAATRQRQRETWVKILSGGQDMAKDYLDTLERESEQVRQIMAQPAICIEETASVDAAAQMMGAHRIKRLLVLRDGRVTGVVTRADLLRFFASAEPGPARPVTPEFFESALETRRRATHGGTPPPPPAVSSVSAAELRGLVEAFEQNKSFAREEAHRLAKAKRDEQVKLLLNSPFTPAEFSHLLAQAREAARRGETSVAALTFPAALCSDGGRAINLPDPAWPASLRGKAADFFLLWERELKPQGFALSARIVSFPDGFPGDAELALVWGR